MREERGFRPIHFLFGLLMGGADIIPGVSGGTVALILGIYERLVGGIRDVASAVIEGLRGRWRDARAALLAVEWGLLIPLGIGILTAIVIGARLIEPLLESYPVQLRALFFGLIAASIAVPWRRMQDRRRRYYGYAAAGAIAAFLLVGIPPREVADPRLIAVFFAATVAICAMILPGVSGSFLLLVMGMYQPTLAAVNDRDLLYVAVFMLGAAIGIGVFSRLLHYLLRHHHDPTMAVLVGLMIGSLRALWPYQNEARGLLAPPSLESLLGVLAFAVAGFAVIVVLTRLGASRISPPQGTAAGVDTPDERV